jgi:hypothetical protein
MDFGCSAERNGLDISVGFLYAGRHQPGLEQMRKEPIHGEGGGVRQLARDASHFDKQQRIVEQFALAADLVQAVQPGVGLGPIARCLRQQAIYSMIG